jgi:hypothetical protein
LHAIISSPLHRRLQLVGRCVAVYLICLLAVVAVYRKTNVTFLRGDSGYYQIVANLPTAERNVVLKRFWSTSVDGHFTPLPFSAELLFTRLAGTHANVWRWRQMAVVALVASAIFFATAAALRALEFSRLTARLTAAGIAGTFLFHPLTTDLVAWPFHVMQLGWMFAAAVTFWFVVQTAVHPASRRYHWGAALSGYATMHALGLGFTTAVATAAVLLALLIPIARGAFPPVHRRSLMTAFAMLIVFTLAHALCMLLLVAPHGTGGLPTGRFGLAEALGLIALFPCFALISIPGVIVSPPHVAPVVHAAWPFGLVALFVAVTSVALALRTMWRSDLALHRVRALILVFSCTSFFVALLMISARQWKLPIELALLGYLTGPRYLLPIVLTMLGALLWMVSFGSQRGHVLVAACAIALGAATGLAHHGYAELLTPQVAKLNGIPHEHAWSLIVVSAREARAAGLAMPNIPLGNLTQEFSAFDLKLFEPLLRKQLHLAPTDRLDFIPWDEFRKADQTAYQQRVPSLRKAFISLHVEPH